MEPPRRDRSPPKEEIEPIDRFGPQSNQPNGKRENPRGAVPVKDVNLGDYVQPSAAPSNKPFIASWHAMKTSDVLEKRKDLAEKFDPELLNEVHDQVVQYFQMGIEKVKGYTGAFAMDWLAPHLVTADTIESTVLTLLGNLVEGYERDMKQPFPKEDSILGLINYLSFKGQNQEIKKIAEKYQEINRSSKKPEEKAKEKASLYSNLTTFVLNTAFPGGYSDLGLGRMLNWPAWQALGYYAPGLLQSYVEPYIEQTKAEGSVRKLEELETQLKQAHGEEILEFARVVGRRAKKIVSEKIVEMSSGKLAAAKTPLEQKLFAAAKALGEGKGKEFNQLKDMMVDNSYPIMLQLFDHLLKDKPADVKALTHILSKVLLIRTEIQKDRERILNALKGMTPEEIKEALEAVGKPKPKKGFGESAATLTAPKEILTGILEARVQTVTRRLGLSTHQVSQITSDYAGQTLSALIEPLLATTLVEFYTAANTPYTFSRPIADYETARQTLEAIMGGKILDKVDELLESHADEDAKNEDLEPGQTTPIDPVREKQRLGAALADMVNKGLNDNEKISPNFFIDALSGLLKQESYRDLRAALRSFGGEYMTALLGNLAASNPSNPPGDVPVAFWPAALGHLIHILYNEIQDPSGLQVKLLDWKKMPNTTPEEIKAKEDYKTKVLLPLFLPAVKKLLEKGRLREDQFLPLPSMVKKPLLELLENQILPELLFDFAQGLAWKSSMTAAEWGRIDQYKNSDKLEVLGTDIAELGLQMLKKSLVDNAATIAHSLNESLAQKELNAAQEAQLAEGIETAIPAIPDPLLAILIPNLSREILWKLAASYQGAYRGDATTAALLQLRLRFAEAGIDEKIYKQILTYNQRNPRILQLETRLAALRKEALHPPEGKDKATILTEIDRLEHELKNQGSPQEQKARRQELKRILLQFRPLAIALLGNIGIKSAADLPLASVAQESTYLTLIDSVVPDQLMHAYIDYLQFGQREYVQFGDKSETHKARLDRRFGVPQGQHSVVVNALSAYANIATHYADNWIVANAEELSNLVRQGLRPPGAVQELGVPPDPGQILTTKKNPRVVGSAAPLRTEFLFPALRKEIKAVLFDIVDNFVTNLDAMQDQAKFGPMVLAEVRVLTGHLQALNAVTGGAVFLHEAVSSRLAAELERTGRKHPAFPGSADLAALEANEARMGKLNPASPEYAALKEFNEGKRKEAQEHLEKTFYKDLTLWVLRMAGKKGPEDLNVAPMLQQQLWKALTAQIGPSSLRNTFETMGSPEMMNKLLTTIAVKLNAALDVNAPPAAQQGPQAPPRAYREVEGAADTFTAFLEQLGQAIPGTWTQTLLGKAKIRKVLGRIIESSIREVLTDWSLRGIAEMALTVPPPQEALPVTRAELSTAQGRKIRENEAAIADFKTNTNQLPALIRNILNEKSRQGWGAWFGAHAFRFVEQSLAASIDNTSEPLRLSIMSVPVHANLWYNMLSTFMDNYPAPLPPVPPPAAAPPKQGGPVVQEP